MTESPSQSLAKKILTLEAQAVAQLVQCIDDSFDVAINLVTNMDPSGRLIVSGIGKAGFIAQKISATFASTGLPSYFLHPAEAVHGDLGRFTGKDIALVLSNSGSTEEIVRMLPFIKRRGCPLISMTSKPDSPLAQHSDVVLQLGEFSEAGPLGLAPTTSTTVMLALGDALAMAVQQEQNFTKEQFAQFHPGGALGRALMTVQEVMRTGKEQCLVTPDMLCREVLHEIASTPGRPGAAAIVDSAGKLIGMFTDGDLRRCLDREPQFLEQPIREYMTSNPKTIGPTQLVQTAIKYMAELKVDQLIVVDEKNSPVGLLDVQDIIPVWSK